jgi:hypothetical protein
MLKRPYHYRERPLSERQALELMRQGARLVCMHGRPHQYRWFVLPGGAITDETAANIVRHASVIGQKDGLFPGHHQTWRMQSFVPST